jgi:hypothetical protein
MDANNFGVIGRVGLNAPKPKSKENAGFGYPRLSVPALRSSESEEGFIRS